MKLSGYSGTPLSKKLGLKSGFVIRVIQAPKYYLELFEEWPDDVFIDESIEEKKDLIHFFTKSTSQLASELMLLRNEIKPNGMIWVSWPKKSSKVPTDITEDVIRKNAFQNQLVDVKVCAVDEVWSGLKLVIRVKDR